MTPSPLVKHEDIPADEGMMPSLFSAEATPSMDTADLWATPDRDLSSPMPEATPEAGEKKPKKRKSWGQVLPEPKTSLPPRFVHTSLAMVNLTHRAYQADNCIESGPRLKTKKNNAESSESFAIVAQPSPLESESARRLRLSP